MDLETAEKYSRMIGDTTVVKVATNGSSERKNQSRSLKGHALILASDLMKLSVNKAIIFYAKENSFKADLIPWHCLQTNNSSINVNDKNSNDTSLKLINFQKDYYYDIKLKR